MQWTSILAICSSSWCLAPSCCFLSASVRTTRLASKGSGATGGAPVEFRPGRLMVRAVVLATILTTLYVANYINGWIGPEDLIFWGPSAGAIVPQAFERLCQHHVELALSLDGKVTLTACRHGCRHRPQHRLEVVYVAAHMFAESWSAS